MSPVAYATTHAVQEAPKPADELQRDVVKLHSHPTHAAPTQSLALSNKGHIRTRT
ncbi:MAG: hypothetical protein M1825_003284 [Sarcosagium campestre]|nr:MAG: hypothetical protein M1825_003284 [Sarcosagium campestre]